MHKVKLFAYIATFCFAVSALCFGILSVTKTKVNNYDMAGNLVYDSTDCYVTIETQVYASEAYLTQEQMYEQIDMIINKYDFSSLVRQPIGGLNYDSVQDVGGKNQKSFNLSFSDVAPKKQAFFVVMDVRNIGDYYINVGANTPVSLPNNVYSVNSGLYTWVRSGASVMSVIAFSLEDTKMAITPKDGDNATFSVKLNIERYIDEDILFDCSSTGKIFASSQYLDKLRHEELLNPIDLYIPSFLNGTKVTAVQDFQNCTNLTSIFVPTSVETVSHACFAGCSSLTSLTLPFLGEKNYSSVDDPNMDDPIFNCLFFLFGNESGPGLVEVYNGRYSCYIPESLVSLELLYGCKCINYYALGDESNNFRLTNIVLPSSITRIESKAFSGLQYLQKLEIPSSVTEIGENALAHCVNLTSLTLPFIGKRNYTSYANIAEVEGSDDPIMGTLGWILYDAPNLTDITILDGCKFISCYAFGRSTDNPITHISLPSTLERIEEYAFYECANLQELTIPSSVREIGENALAGCAGLKSLTLPFIGRRNYQSNQNIYEVDSSSGDPDYFGTISWLFDQEQHVENMLGVDTYNFCYMPANLTKLEILEGCLSMCYKALKGCEQIQKIILPSSIKQITDSCMDRCKNLTTIISKAIIAPKTIAPDNNYVFLDGADNLVYVYIPSGSLDSYKKDAGWCNYAQYFVEMA